MYQNKYKKIGIGPTMTRILLARNYDYEDIRKLMKEPSECLEDPEALFGCKRAAEDIIDMVNKNLKIWVFADYDVDGLTAGYIMTTYLKGLGANVQVYYPERKEGYGLNTNFARGLKENEAIITVDNGVAAIDTMGYCKSHNIPLVITDHHEPVTKSIDICAICDAFMQRKEKGVKIIGQHLCGAAVAWKVCQQIDKLLKRDEAWRLAPYAAIGTISDVMPMTLENMIIVKIGLQLIEQGYAPNIKNFFDLYGIKEITADDVAWKLAPMLNACGRMGNVYLAAKFLFFEGNDSYELNKIILEIDEINKKRKRVSDMLYEKALSYDYSEDCFCLFDATGYPSGISGLIANRLAENYQKPAIVYSRNSTAVWPGSVRSYNGFDILPYFRALKEKGYIGDYGGHAQACGVSLTPDIKSFKKHLNGIMRMPLYEYSQQERFIDVDVEIALSEVNNNLWQEIRKIPTDNNLFPKPMFIVRDLNVHEVSPSRNNPNNIKLSLVDKDKIFYNIWAWGKGEHYKSIGSPKNIDIIGTVTISTFGNDCGKPVFRIEDIRDASTN